MGDRIVIALGGNALQTVDGSPTFESQMKACQQTAEKIAELLEKNYELIITHGNGPQVGNIVIQNEISNSSRTPSMPLHVCGAMSQGEIGYWLQQSILNEIYTKNINKSVCTIISQVVVDENDKAFESPSKPIGPFYDEIEAKKISDEKGYIMKEDAGRGWRRVVASPVPVNLVEKDAIRLLISEGIVTIVGGGGGIPVVKEDNRIKGVSAVIDKDLTSEMIAEMIDADILLILTAVDNVSINFNKPNQQPIYSMNIDDAKRYIKEGQFAPGSMLPKIKAAIKFVTSKRGRKCIITSLEKAVNAIEGKSGTLIS
ncbi:carbamate kinase [Sporanaerobacter sp. PP17-6a]|uniref:carbamate kinase n=1 Tax=Sporanaerobacter sp. PP17-6a TaxID=1891289 RepID=UPI00089FE05F|nr:carbamate kinase [Sporanaerobacter sp. PP17-6a]SCL91365.1 Carbamate kinase 2 [Sporanaerobacter sp. PP17-6a]